MNQEFLVKVISLKNKKTATVELTKTKLHYKYYKPIKEVKKIQAHNENIELQIGDLVLIKASRPYSATKRFIVVKKIEKVI